jgi:ribosomal protein S13
MARFHIQPWAKVGTLKNATVLELTTELSEMKVENDLRREVQENIRRLKDMGTYRGRRHAMGLPVRGQRTRTQVKQYRRNVWRTVLTPTDYNGSATEQDRTWRLRANEWVDGGSCCIPCNKNVQSSYTETFLRHRVVRFRPSKGLQDL